MRTRNLLLIVFCFGFGCAKSPYRFSPESRHLDTAWGGLSRRIIGSSLLSSDGKNLVFGTRRGTLYSVNGDDGSVNWKKRWEGEISSTPLAADGKIYFGTSKGKAFQVDATTGREIWSKDFTGEVVGTPALINGKLLVGTNDGYVNALNAETGQPKWRYKRDLPDRITIRGFAMPVEEKGRIYCAFSDGGIVALDAEDGKEAWTTRLSSKGRFPDVVSPLLLASSQVLAAQYDGNFYSLDFAGKTRWTVDDTASASAVLSDGPNLVIPAADGKIRLVDAVTGESKWTFETPYKSESNWSGLLKDGNRLLAATYDGTLYVIDAANGKLEWRYDTGAAIAGAPVRAGSSVWLLTKKGALYRLASRR